jgi:anti-anti-sigma factor
VVDSTAVAMDGPQGTGPSHPLFGIKQRHDADGAVRMTLLGEMDLSTSEGFQAHLDRVQQSSRRVRLDLSELEFIDCSGMRTILNAMSEARRSRRELEVGRTVSPMVQRVVSLARLAEHLWPGDVPDLPPAAAAA